MLPTGVRDVLRRRLGQRPPSTVTLLETAAVLGRESSVSLLADVAQQPLDSCLDALEPALEDRLVDTPQRRARIGPIRSRPRPGGVGRRPHVAAARAGSPACRRGDPGEQRADRRRRRGGGRAPVARRRARGRATGPPPRSRRAAQVALRRQALVSAELSLQRAATLYRAAGTEQGLAELRVLRQLGFVGAALHGYTVQRPTRRWCAGRGSSRWPTDRLDVLVDLIWADWAGCDTGGQPTAGPEASSSRPKAVVAGVDDPLAQRAAVGSMRAFNERHFGRMNLAYRGMEEARGAVRDRRSRAGGRFLPQRLPDLARLRALGTGDGRGAATARLSSRSTWPRTCPSHGW